MEELRWWGANIESSLVWDTSCLVELILDLINRPFLCRKCHKPVKFLFLLEGKLKFQMIIALHKKPNIIVIRVHYLGLESQCCGKCFLIVSLGGLRPQICGCSLSLQFSTHSRLLQ